MGFDECNKHLTFSRVFRKGCHVSVRLVLNEFHHSLGRKNPKSTFCLEVLGRHSLVRLVGSRVSSFSTARVDHHQKSFASIFENAGVTRLGFNLWTFLPILETCQWLFLVPVKGGIGSI